MCKKKICPVKMDALKLGLYNLYLSPHPHHSYQHHSFSSIPNMPLTQTPTA